MTEEDNSRLLKMYYLHKLCPKCENREVSTTYCSGRNVDFFQLCSQWKLDVRIEHLHRRCQRCRYDWLERCKDDAFRY